MAKDSDILSEALEQFKQSADAESDNRVAALDDIRFARLSEQWPDTISAERAAEGRPMLTINRLPTFIRQVVNDIRQNKPQIHVKPASDDADEITAEIYGGLIRNIELQSNSDIAYDTAAECGVTSAFGYVRVDVDYANDNTFDKDIRILRVANPFSIYGDPRSQEADSSDWRYGFVVESMARKEFERKYKNADAADWPGVQGDHGDWITEDSVRVAEWFQRDEVKRPIVKLSDGQVLEADQYLENRHIFDVAGIKVVGERDTVGHEITHRLITATDILSTTKWAGKYIPLIPVYGDEVNMEGKRYLRSLVRDAKDPQRNFNFWRTAATELVALAPRVPYVGPRGSFTTDKDKWDTINRKSHPFVEYDPVQGMPPPQRQPLDSGVAAGALQEALNASDDLKAVMGLYDASLGQRSNETSGRAIMARQREGDTSTFHFIDNVARAVRHTGRVLIDLIPKVYSGERMLRILDEKGAAKLVKTGVPIPELGGRILDLNIGRYDLVVKSGPSYTTKRDEAAFQQIEFAKVTNSGGLFADIIASNMDWPGADEIAARLKAALPPHIRGEAPPPEVQQMMQQMQQMQVAMQQMQQQLAEATQQVQAEKADKEVDMAEVQVKMAEVGVKQKEVQVKEAELQLKAQELANEALQLQTQMAAAQMDTTGISQAITSLQQQVEQMANVHQELLKPRKRKGRARKLEDGSWELEAVDGSDGAAYQ